MSADRSKPSRQDLRVLKKNMVYCSGVPCNISQDQLISESYFGRYGKILKVIVNPYPNKNYCSLYITYSHEFEAATAILACNGAEIGRSTLWCLFGTMKYCRFFLKKIECKNLPDCPYLHLLDKNNEIEINNSPSEAYPKHQSLARGVFNRYPDKIAHIVSQNKPDGELPSPLEAIERYSQNKSQEQTSVISQQASISSGTEEDIDLQMKITEKNSGKTKQQSLDSIIKSMIIKQLEKSKGSRVIQTITQQQKQLKAIMITGLLE